LITILLPFLGPKALPRSVRAQLVEWPETEHFLALYSSILSSTDREITSTSTGHGMIDFISRSRLFACQTEAFKITVSLIVESIPRTVVPMVEEELAAIRIPEMLNNEEELQNRTALHERFSVFWRDRNPLAATCGRNR
jgi:hypothetical protein